MASALVRFKFEVRYKERNYSLTLGDARTRKPLKRDQAAV